MATMTNTQAVEALDKGMYKRFTDAHMTALEIKSALADKGIYRTLNQVKYDLEERYPEFKGYLAKHPEPRAAVPKPSTRELAALDEAKKAKPTRRIEFKLCTDYAPTRHNSIADDIRRAGH